MRTLLTFTLCALLIAPVAYGQSSSVVLTDAERARVATHGDWLAFLDTQCQPIERKVIDHRETVRFQCPQAVERVDVPTGDISRERKPSVGARLKRWSTAALVGGLTLIYLMGRSQ